MLGTGQGGGKCCGKAIGEVNPSTLGKTTSLKLMVVVVVVSLVYDQKFKKYIYDNYYSCVLFLKIPKYPSTIK